MVKITFIGGTQTVTGSKYLLEFDDKKILVDCGLFQGLKELRLRNRAEPPFDPKSLDAVILTHAHLDHSGYLPLLIEKGFRGPVYSTSATFDLCQILLPDSGYLQEEEAYFANKHGFSKHHPALPLYTQRMAENSLKSFHPISFHTPFNIGKIRASFSRSGHILGAACICLELKNRKIIFSGDVGRPNDPILKAPETLRACNDLILESTYGNRLHEPIDPEDHLAKIINKTINRGGVVLIPAFAVGRAQLILYFIMRLRKKKSIPSIPIYLNSPMAINASDLLKKYANELNISNRECDDLCHVANYVRNASESKALNAKSEPMIIISASGMATGGRVLHHLRKFLPDPKNSIVFTGFQAVGTRGHTIVSGAKEVKMHGMYVPIAAEIHDLENLSAHADANEIISWLKQMPSLPQKIWITHGEPQASSALKEKIISELGLTCEIPKLMQTVKMAD